MTVKQCSSTGMNWYQDAKYGMFIHWGLYSIIGRGEGILYGEKIPIPEYEKLMTQFNPVKFNARDWISMAADAGQKYMVITSRHIDGFNMYDTALSDFKVTRTAFKRDPLSELANECARRDDFKLGFYSCLIDLHHPAYRFRKESGLAWSDWVEYLHGQIRELCTNFGEIESIWLDGDWPRATFGPENMDWTAGGGYDYEKLYDMIHTLQPNAIIHNNRHTEPLPGEDIQGFEQDLPGQNTAGFNPTEIYHLPLESCITINTSWSHWPQDDDHKSPRQLVHILARCASSGANLLLATGPTALGEFLPVHLQRMQMVQKWLSIYGEAIYGTRAGVIPPTTSVVSTRKGNIHYVHLLDYISDCVLLKNVPENLTNASLVKDGTHVKMERKADKVILTVPLEQRDDFDTVIKLDTNKIFIIS
jgi:alpha-L-fucosidase